MKCLNFVKGVIIGIAKIIPGLSGAVLMMSFNLYDKAIFAITNFFDDVKKNFLFLLELGIGIIVGIVCFSRVISFFLNYYYLYTCCLFVGLILGGMPVVFKSFSKNWKNMFLMLCSFLSIFFLSIFHVNTIYKIRGNAFDYVVFFFSGILEAIGTILPGVSSTVLLLLVGIYSYYISVIGNVFSIASFVENFSFLFPFLSGMICGIVFVSLGVSYLFRHYKNETFSVIFGFSMASIFLFIIQIISNVANIYSFVVGLILLFVGFLITCWL